MARYLLLRIAEDFNVKVSFDPKPVKGDWNGAGCHTNFSTLKTRSEGGYKEILRMLNEMKKCPLKHIEVYGTGNDQRLTGAHETAAINVFTYGVADRGASCRIPRTTEREKCG